MSIPLIPGFSTCFNSSSISVQIFFIIQFDLQTKTTGLVTKKVIPEEFPLSVESV